MKVNSRDAYDVFSKLKEEKELLPERIKKVIKMVVVNSITTEDSPIRLIVSMEDGDHCVFYFPSDKEVGETVILNLMLLNRNIFFNEGNESRRAVDAMQALLKLAFPLERCKSDDDDEEEKIEKTEIKSRCDEYFGTHKLSKLGHFVQEKKFGLTLDIDEGNAWNYSPLLFSLNVAGHC